MVRTERIPSKHGDALWLVSVDGRPTGLVSRLPANGGLSQPFKAFRGIGPASRLVGVYRGNGGLAQSVATIVG